MRCRWSRGTWGASSDHTTLKLQLFRLVVVKQSLLAEPRLCRAPFKSDLWRARDDREARYVSNIMEMKSVSRSW